MSANHRPSPQPASDHAALPAGLRRGGRFHAWRRVAPRYVLLDVDGTLVGSGGSIAPEVLAAAERAAAAGVSVGVATGRGAGSVMRLVDGLPLPGPHVVANGGEVVLDGRVVHADPLDPEVVEQVLAAADYAEVYIGQEYYVTDFRDQARAHWRLLGHPPAGSVDDARQDPSVGLRSVAKVTAVEFDDDGDAAGRLAALPVTLGTSTSPVTPGLQYHNVTAAHADKGTALRAAVAVLAIDADAAMVVGDERNDLAMLAVAGTAVAMGQAAEPIREAAHLVTASVDEHGAAVALDAAARWADAAATSD